MPASLDPRLPFREIDPAFLPPRDPILGYVKVGGKNPEIRYTRAGKPWVSPTRLLNPARFEITTREKLGQNVKGRKGSNLANETFSVDLGYQRDLELHKEIGEAPSSLRVRLMYPTWKQNMIAFLGAWGGGRWVCRGNGVEATHVTSGACACPCPRLTQFEGEYSGTHPNDGARYKDGNTWKTDGFFPCKPRAQLDVVLEDAGTFGGFWAFKTTSFETISNLTKSMMMFEQMFERIDGLLLELRVQAVTKQLPAGGTTLQPIVTFVLAASMDTARQIGSDAAAESRKFLPAGGPIEESVYREAVIKEMQDEAESTAGEFSPEEELEVLESTDVDEEEEAPSVDTEPKSGDPDEPTGAGMEEEGAESPAADEVDEPTSEEETDPDGFDEPASAHRKPGSADSGQVAEEVGNAESNNGLPSQPDELPGDSDRNKQKQLARAVLEEIGGWTDEAITDRLAHHIKQRNFDELLERLERNHPDEWAKVQQSDLFADAEPDDGLPS